MGVNSSKGFNFRLMASGSAGYQQLDTFSDEEILVSNNVTGLFDLGVLPSDFTRQITIPGTKVNDAFFQHVYDIAVDNPYLFKTNVKVPAYFDFDGIYVSQGYLQLNKVNVYANKFVESYEISIYGGLSSFGRDVNRFYLTDLTSSLSSYNHTASYENISSSWEGNLFGGDIVYPLIEYGQKIQYTPETNLSGIDSVSGSLCIQDFKPAIRIKKVWDAIFQQFGYTYSSSFWDQSFLDNVYMVCNNNLRYPVYENLDLETYGLFKIAPVSGSGTDLVMNAGTSVKLDWFNIQKNPSNSISSTLDYSVGIDTRLRGLLNLNFEVSSSGAGNGIPQFYLELKDSGGTIDSITPLTTINNYLLDVQLYNSPQTKTEKFELLTNWNSQTLTPDTYEFYLRYENSGGSNFQVTLNPDGNTKAYLETTKVNQGGDTLVMDIASNMPYGTSGIKLIDFITSIQKKYNLVIYPNKTKPREFIVETFNNWYGKGEVKDFNRYINLNEKIEVIPANNLAVNELNFGDTLDGDYISQQFAKGANREYGKSYYVDTENFFSQGKFEVKTKFASSPLTYLANTGTSGSASQGALGFRAQSLAQTEFTSFADCETSIKVGTQFIVEAYAAVYSPGGQSQDNDPNSGYSNRTLPVGTDIVFNFDGGGISHDWTFERNRDGVITDLDFGTSSTATYTYTIEQADIDAGFCYFSVYGSSGDI